MKSTRTSDREFTQSVGIKQDCEMCELLHIDIERQKDETTHREQVCWFLIQVALSRESRLRTWKLAAFGGWVMAVLLGIASLHHA